MTFFFYHKFVNDWEKYERVINKDKPIIRIDLKEKTILTIAVLGFVLSGVTFGVALSLPHCKGLPENADPHSCYLKAVTVVRSEKVSHNAMLQELQSIVAKAHEQSGNLAYEIIVNLKQEGDFAIESLWEDKKSFDRLRNSNAFSDIFSSHYYLSLVVEEIRYGPWAITVPMFIHQLSFVFNVELQCGADSAWKTIGDFSNSS